MKTTHVIVEGRVQGVFYRDYTHRQALQFNLSGWVRNKRDGTVEAIFMGAENNVQSMLDWLWQGSPSSRVDNIRISEITPEEQYTTFEIRF